jgi:hypothetical protein
MPDTYHIKEEMSRLYNVLTAGLLAVTVWQAFAAERKNQKALCKHVRRIPY